MSGQGQLACRTLCLLLPGLLTSHSEGLAWVSQPTSAKLCFLLPRSTPLAGACRHAC